MDEIVCNYGYITECMYINAVDLKLTSFNYKVKICCFLSSRWLFFSIKRTFFKPDPEPGGEKTTVPM